MPELRINHKFGFQSTFTNDAESAQHACVQIHKVTNRECIGQPHFPEKSIYTFNFCPLSYNKA